MPERRACVVVNQHRSTQSHCLVRSPEEMGLRQRIRALAVKYPRYGYPRIHVMLLRDGYQVNRKRVQRLWCLEVLHVYRPKRHKPKIARVPVVIRGRYLNHVWAIDFQFDETADGRPVKILNVTDEYTSEALATNAARRITGAGTMAVLDQICGHRGASEFLAWSTGQSSLPTLCAPGAENKTFKLTIATRVHHGKTVVSNHSTRDSETNY